MEQKVKFNCYATSKEPSYVNSNCPLHEEWLDFPYADPSGCYSHKDKCCICSKCGLTTGYWMNENGDFINEEEE